MITIDGKEYTEDQLTDQQKYLVAQVQDVNSKIQNLQFQLDQLSVTKDAFSNQIILSVRESEAAAAEDSAEEPSSPDVVVEPAAAAQ